MATDGAAKWWWWLVVVGLTVTGFAASLWQLRRQADGPVSPAIAATGERSVALRGNATGSISTGNTGTPPVTVATNSPGTNGNLPTPGSVTAAGTRSIVVEGDTGGDISTGDHYN
ncbi:hypothetical protein [Nocardia sp. NPDC005825]|uniref:hypothetical protein n=1 Tax=unclassified Nocardia TaxID=2637762 RepID=UPI00340ECF0F